MQVPKPRHTPVADDVATVKALNTPKKVAEGLGFAQKGTGETPHLVCALETRSTDGKASILLQLLQQEDNKSLGANDFAQEIAAGVVTFSITAT